MKYGVLGPLEALDDGVQVASGRLRQRALLGLLLTQPNRAVSVDRLLDLLWWGEPPYQAIATLRTYVSNCGGSWHPTELHEATPRSW